MTRCAFVQTSAELAALLGQSQPVATTPAELKCPNCGAPLQLKNSKFGLFFGCVNWRTTRCRGSVRANPDGSPVGMPVDDATKDARMAAHDVFDQLWKGGRLTRRGAYSWLAELMGLPADKAHIGLFSKEQCAELIEVVGQCLTEDEQLQMAERELMGDVDVVLAENDREIVDGLPRDRDALARKLRGGYVRADSLCRLLRISLGTDEGTTIRNIADALREYDRRRGVTITLKKGP